MSHMSGPHPRMPGESKPGKERRGTEVVVAKDLTNKHAYKAREKGKVQTDLENDVIETGKEIKYVETLTVFEESAPTKTEPTTAPESPETWH